MGRPIAFWRSAGRSCGYVIDVCEDKDIADYTKSNAKTFRDELLRRGLTGSSSARVWPAEDALQPSEAMGERWGLREDDGGPGLGRLQAEDQYDRRGFPEDAPHDFESAVEIGGADDQRGRLIGRTKGEMNTKLHAITDTKGRPLKFFMTEGQVSDYTGAAALLGSLPAAD